LWEYSECYRLQFYVRHTSKRWLLKIIQVTMHETWSLIFIPCTNSSILHINLAFAHSICSSSIVWRELRLAPPLPPMRVLEAQWSRTWVLCVCCLRKFSVIGGCVLDRAKFRASMVNWTILDPYIGLRERNSKLYTNLQISWKKRS
jgi:hypothetical protein